MYINNTNEIQANEISGYIGGFVEKTKENTSIDFMRLLFESIRQNLILAVLMWFAGLTVIRSYCSIWNNYI